VLIGSADWMDRNLSRRVEVVFPIEQADLKHRLIQEILAISLADNVKARELGPDGMYRRVVAKEGEPLVRSQEKFLQIAAENAARRQNVLEAPIVHAVEPRPVRKQRGRRRQTG
jgi:polyphosphate kinase